jgi:hypothetical protein
VLPDEALTPSRLLLAPWTSAEAARSATISGVKNSERSSGALLSGHVNSNLNSHRKKEVVQSM